jgi:hypothetical protein
VSSQKHSAQPPLQLAGVLPPPRRPTTSRPPPPGPGLILPDLTFLPSAVLPPPWPRAATTRPSPATGDRSTPCSNEWRRTGELRCFCPIWRSRCYKACGSVAPIGMRCCYQRHTVVLPSACGVAPSAGRRCSHRHAPLLSAARGGAPISMRRCYQRPAALLPVAAGVAARGHVVLPAAAGFATIGRRRCFKQLAALLLKAGKVAARGQRCCCQRPTTLLQTIMPESSPATAVLP